MSAFPLPHRVERDPGTRWSKNDPIAIDAPPDAAADLAPDAAWPTSVPRAGSCGAVSACTIALPDGTLRMYYTQILPRPGFPDGANDYDNAATRILSAHSSDGLAWTPEPGVRLSPQQVDEAMIRVVAPEVVPTQEDRTILRMYFETCSGPRNRNTPIRSARSEDGGLTWQVEPGNRFGGPEDGLSGCRLIELEDGRCRLYLSRHGHGIISALSTDGGWTFTEEPGIRLAPATLPYDAATAFSPEVLLLPTGGYRMYYAGYSDPTHAYVLTATSEDGLTWQKHPEPIITPGGRYDRLKCSEMTVAKLPDSDQYRMYYEACDGTTHTHRGVWRILSATAK